MDIEEIYKEFIDKIAEIRVAQFSVNQTVKNEYNNYKNLMHQCNDAGVVDFSSFSSIYNLFFDNLITEKINDRADFREISISEYEVNIVKRKNKQYQWLLAEGYEAYERYLIMAYACLGFYDNAAWSKSDFGDVSDGDLQREQFSFFVNRSNAKRDKPNGILNRMRVELPDFKDKEIENFINVNFKFIIILLQNLRHVIVHNGGQVYDISIFKRRVFEKSGVYNNGNTSDVYIGIVDSLVKDFYGCKTVCLLERYDSTSLLPGVYSDTLMSVLKSLISHAHCVKEAICKHLNKV